MEYAIDERSGCVAVGLGAPTQSWMFRGSDGVILYWHGRYDPRKVSWSMPASALRRARTALARLRAGEPIKRVVERYPDAAVGTDWSLRRSENQP